MGAFVVMVSVLLWAADTLPRTHADFVYVTPTYDVEEAVFYLPGIPTAEEMRIAVALTSFYPQGSPEQTVTVFREILRALVENRSGDQKEEAPGLLRHSSRGSGSYID